MTSPKGFPIEGKHDKDLEQNIQLKPKFATVPPKGSNRRALDVIGGGFYEVAAGVIVEAGSDDNLVVVTGHGAKKGDVIHIQTSANNVEEEQMFVEEVIDANSFKLSGALSAPLVAADTFDHMRFVMNRLAPDGSSTATMTAPPAQFIKDGVTVTVTEDTATPANNVPYPVKLTGVTGDINISANDLNVALSHLGVSADSTRIGNGVNEWAINASLEGLVRDADSITELQAILAKIIAAPATEAKQDSMIGDLGQILTELQLKADLTETQPVSIASSPLPTGAATEATLSEMSTAVSTEATLAAMSTAVAKETTLAAMSAAVATEATLSSIDGKDFATQTTLALLEGKDFSTETTLAAQSAKLPASLGKKANTDSLSVTLSNDEGSLPGAAFDVRTFFNYDIAAGNIATTGYSELIANTGGVEIKQMKIFMSAGTPLLLAIGAASSEVDKAIIPPGGFADGRLDITIPANSRLSVKAIGTTSTAGNIIANLLG